MLIASSAELKWLQQLIDWSQNNENYIHSFQNRAAERSDTAEMDEWLDQFIQIRKVAENQLNSAQKDLAQEFSLVNRQLYEDAFDLNKRFSNLIKGNLPEVWNGTAGSKKKENYSVPIGEHSLPPLPYEYDALEPYISEKIMRLHHDKHHKGYVEGLNKAEKEMQKSRKTGDFSLIRHWEREAAFNGAGHYLHTIFWNNMIPDGGGEPTGAIAKEIDRTFGSFKNFKQHFSNAAKQVQSVGWALLVWSPRSWRTEILQAEEHHLFTQQDIIPLLVLDVWEHAYYLQYTNKRGEYVDAWWNVVNWEDVNRRFEEARKVKWEPY